MTLTRTTLLLTMMLAPFIARAHPIPDIPVRASFDGAGHMTLRIEVDPRCFEADPNKAPSVLNKDLAALPATKINEWKAKAIAYADHAVEVKLEPVPGIKPDFHFDLTGQDNVSLQGPDDIVVLTGTWQTSLPAEAQRYGINARPEGTLSVLFFNEVKGQKLERFQVLFPGESSYQLDLKALAPIQKAAAAIVAKDEEPTVPAFGLSWRKVATTAAVFFVVGLLVLRAKRR